MNDLPNPLTPADCDCTDLDGFMLNVERLMASELVALSSLEVIGAALLLWSRAWKQKPAASLPDDERVIAAFAKLSVPRFRKLRDEVLRGFVKCSDGRLYHRTLAAEAIGAYERKIAFRKKRETDADRLRRWRETARETRHETRDETSSETQSETRFVAEGQGQGQGHKKHSAPRFDAQAHLESFGVPPELARDWLAVRKAKRLAPTATAFDAAKAEADAAGISMADALRTCVVRGWGGFKAAWLNDSAGRVNGHESDNPFA
ncbi:YdaU family protein [Burkholderia multivorans]|uniref:YdaU family protein n=1 Tax=Burkholderia multivorans TaxID=87883 RepID=UPI0021BFFA6A|nr:YdaU family protein [Burkholderia multivorans]